ncbi:hypothetical protein ESCO_002780 [Escovopsis weberi]|uniref:Vacuolar h+-atpase assembly protein n=1 Tax=Escovopsis weberi TaxID=150374 RepID=A0A0M8MRK4_ESCWE|nr:hypothetical protein ESCO_002780 [Escovopsis weberi]
MVLLTMSQSVVDGLKKLDDLHDASETDVETSAGHTSAKVNRPSAAADMGDDEVTVNEIHRQVTLIINFLVSIAGVAATLWIAARWWSTPARLFLTMGGSLVVAIAEVAVYSGYMWRLEKSKQRQVATREVKQVVKTWVVGQDSAGDGSAQEHTVLLAEGKDEALDEGNLRKRHAAALVEG